MGKPSVPERDRDGKSILSCPVHIYIQISSWQHRLVTLLMWVLPYNLFLLLTMLRHLTSVEDGSTGALRGSGLMTAQSKWTSQSEFDQSEFQDPGEEESCLCHLCSVWKERTWDGPYCQWQLQMTRSRAPKKSVLFTKVNKFWFYRSVHWQILSTEHKQDRISPRPSRMGEL